MSSDLDNPTNTDPTILTPQSPQPAVATTLADPATPGGTAQPGAVTAPQRRCARNTTV